MTIRVAPSLERTSPEGAAGVGAERALGVRAGPDGAVVGHGDGWRSGSASSEPFANTVVDAVDAVRGVLRVNPAVNEDAVADPNDERPLGEQRRMTLPGANAAARPRFVSPNLAACAASGPVGVKPSNAAKPSGDT